MGTWRRPVAPALGEIAAVEAVAIGEAGGEHHSEQHSEVGGAVEAERFTYGHAEASRG